MKFAVKELQSELAQKFWQKSQSASVFLHPHVAERLAKECRWFFLLKGDEPLLMWPIATNSNGGVAPPPFSYFFGPKWADTVEVRAVSTRHRVQSDGLKAMIEYLVADFSELHFDLPPDALDVRPFTWWNYGASKDSQFHVEPMYTAQISALGAKPDEVLLRNFRSVRRQEVRRVEDAGDIEIVHDFPWDDAVAVYASVMNSNGIDIKPDEPSLVALGQLVQSGWGFALGARQRGDKRLGAISVVLRAKKVSNLVLMGSHPEFREKGVGAWHTLQTLRLSRQLGDNIFDFNGANSPNRGDDKHSFGAVEKLYFRLAYGATDDNKS